MARRSTYGVDREPLASATNHCAVGAVATSGRRPMIRATIRLGRIGGVTVGVNWTVLVIIWLLTWNLAVYTLPESAPGRSWLVYWIVGFVGALGLVASILAHEVGHAMTARRHDVAVREITLWMFGGIAKLGTQAPDPGTELRIALAGPATSVAIGTASLTLAAAGDAAGVPDVLTVALAWLGVINLVLAVFNLLRVPLWMADVC